MLQTFLDRTESEGDLTARLFLLRFLENVYLFTVKYVENVNRLKYILKGIKNPIMMLLDFISNK